MDPVQYAIDFAATMSGGNQTVAELSKLASTFDSAGRGSAVLADAMTRTSSSLDAARAASAAARVELADGAKEYGILEKAVVQAQKTLERASVRGVVTPEMVAAVKSATSALDGQASKLRVLEANVASTDASETRLVSTLGNLRTINAQVDKSFAQSADRMGKTQQALGALGGPIGTIGNRVLPAIKGFEELSASIGVANASALLMAAGSVALVAAVVAITVAVVAGAVAVANWAVTLGNAAREQLLVREGAEALRPELVGLRGVFAEVSQATGVAEGDLRDLQKSLADARVSSADMPSALRAVAMAESALGKGGAAQFVDKIKAGTLAVEDFANTAESQFGGVVARRMLGIEAQSSRLSSVLRDTFGSLNIEPALMGMRVLVDLFDQSGVTGKAMRFLFESIFQPLIDQATNAAYAVEAFVIGVLIGMTKIYIAVKPALTAIGEMLGFDDMSLEGVLNAVSKAGEYLAPIIVGMVAAFALMSAAVGVAVIGLGMLMAASIAVGVAVMAFATAVLYGAAQVGAAIRDGVGSAVTWLQSLPSMLATIGQNMIQGLISGILGGAGGVVSALVNVASAGITAVKKTLGIASPSKVFAGIGEFTGEGYVEGVEAMTGASNAAMSALVEPPQSALSAQDALSGNIGGAAVATPKAPEAVAPSGTTIDMRGAQLTFAGKDAPSGIRQFAEMLTKCLEGDAAMIGAEVLVGG